MRDSHRLSESYLSVHYELRPAKQVERRMLVDAFQLLQEAGFRIRSYEYFGMGSVYFVDYVLLHKYLGIQKLVSVEASPSIKKRVMFNRPFGVVNVRHGFAGEFIPSLEQSKQHIVWLDYDGQMTSDHLSDIRQACQQLSPGSIFLVTFDAEPPNRHNASTVETEKYYRSEADSYIPKEFDERPFEREVLPELIMKTTRQVIDDAVRFREDIGFAELFYFQYADGRRMVTLGGMITSETEVAKLSDSEIESAHYLRRNWDTGPCLISVPMLTKRERHVLDAEMPCSDTWRPDGFELGKEELQAYRNIYRFIPAYAELFL